MPRIARLTNDEVKQRIEKYGYFFVPDTKYSSLRNNMKLYDAQLNKTVFISLFAIEDKARRGQRSEFDIYNVLNLYDQQQLQQPMQQQSGFDRFCRKLRNYNKFLQLSDVMIQAAYNEFKLICRKLGLKKKFQIDFSGNAISKDLRLFILLEALQSIKKRMDKMIKIKTTNEDDTYHWFTLSYETIDYFEGLLNDKAVNEINTSENDLFENENDWKTLEVSFENKPHSGGFFPFINKLDSLDLSEFDIFNKIDYENYKNNCFIDALIYSGQFTNEQINLIKSSVYTRVINTYFIYDICELMNCSITVRIPTEEDSKTTAKVFKPKYTNNKTKSIVLFLYLDHFMVNNDLFVTEYYIKNHKEIDLKYKDDETRFEIIDAAGNKKHSKITIVRLIKLLRKYELLEEISEREQLNIARQYTHFNYKPEEIIDEYFGYITSPDKSTKQQKYLNKLFKNDGYYMFGERLNEEELDMLYSSLQKVVDSLNIKVNVRNYSKFSELMKKIMFEYHCFFKVYSLAQPLADVIRKQLVFPKPHTRDGNKFYSNKKLYYIDLNSAYLSVIDGIPTGKCDKDGNFGDEKNTKIKELINRLYNIRRNCKNHSPKLAKCLKLLMTSCWGSSIKRNRVFNKTKPSNIDDFVNKNINRIVEYDDGFVRMIKSISCNFTYPQFAREVLNNYHKKLEAIRKTVTIYYENIDAILIDEDDYNKISTLGLIGEELGKFKIEHIFTEIAIKSSRKFVATLEDGTKLIHCPKKDINYDEFVNEIKNNIYTTKLTV